MQSARWLNCNRILLSQYVILLVAISSCALGQQSASTQGETGKPAQATAVADDKKADDKKPAPAIVSSESSASQASTQTQSATPSDPVPQGLPRPSLPPAFDPAAKVPLYETIQEDWSSLAIGTSKLEPEKPLVAQTDEQDTFIRTLVQVKWRPGDPIDLWIMLPKGVKKPPVVLYLYGFGQDTDRFKADAWVRRVTGGGVAAVGFVSALSGQRFHDRPMKQWFVSELQESIGSTVHDIKFILDYLAERGEVDMDRVGIFGEGSGGTIAILAAAADSRIKALDTLEPWGDWPDFLAKSDLVQKDPNHAEYIKPEFLAKVAPLDPVKWLPGLKIPIRIQQISKLAATPMECKESITKAAPKQSIVARFETAEDLGTKESRGRLFDWIKDSLPAKVDVATDKSSPTKGTDNPVRR